MDAGDHNPRTGKCLDHLATCLIAAAFLLYPLLRALQMGHLLTWDEAMNICTVRSMASLGSDDFSNWFWRHPPLYPTLMLLLAPLRSGFIARVEIFNILLGSANLFLLYLVNRRFLGRLTAAFSVFLIAVTPGSVFFDLWIKRDHLAVTFALLAFSSIGAKRYAVAALMAGLGFLAKETFLFLYIPVFLAAVVPAKNRPHRGLRILIMTLIPAATAIWWYIIASRSGSFSSIGQHFAFATAEGSAWAGGALFYVDLLHSLLGPLGMLLLLGGAMVCVALPDLRSMRTWIWPLSGVLLPLLLLSVIPRKVPWIVIVLLPCVASIQAVGLESSLRVLAAHTKRSITVGLAGLAAAALIALPAFSHSHESMLMEVSPDQHRGATRSRHTARAASSLITNDDRVLLSSFHYWKGVVPGQMCPVFTCYFESRPAILPVPHEAAFEQIVQLISEYDLNWAIVSPEPGANERDVLGGFISDAGLAPVNTGYACIFDTSPLLEEPLSGALDEFPESSE